MSWNYRVVREDGELRVFDVYYNDAGKPVSTHEQPSYVYGDSIAALRQQLERMLRALDEPILEASEIGGAGA